MAEDDVEFEIEDDEGEIVGLDDDERKGDDMLDDEVDENLVENTYYTAKGEVDENLDEALELFQTVLDLEEEKGQWGFKSLKQMVKTLFKAGKMDQMVQRYKELLTYMSIVSRNESEKAINKVLSMVSSSTDKNMLDQIYGMTLEVLLKANNEKLWFNTKLKQGQLFTQTRDWDRLNTCISDLKRWCMLEDGVTPDEKKSSNMLDVYVLEIQMYSEQNQLKKLAQLYQKCIGIISGGAVVLNPRITGIIRECGGKMYMREKKWAEAFNDFFEAFKSYDEAGNPRRIDCLKYLVLASILSQSSINPFDANEAKPYKGHSDIVAMTDLVQHYQQANIKEFDKVLKNNRKAILEDNFMKEYIEDLLKTIRIRVLGKIMKPYTRIKMSFLGKELSISTEDVEALVVDMILDGKLDGYIDQVNQMITLSSQGAELTRYKALSQWTVKLGDVHQAILQRVN
ncbi:hypothetical protein C9374_002098 [Naegleria lovaniensis]|uniref:PCI domain-containing protein n=1 Tax=Naegleria lovaniensis TaxID=51637 RepID=A0AA88GVG6_NAELO|nr:uncharacterized protein C9374_002098 [Naegleria lovaniensis]KAG2387063.1 hypothetical protein C9374_002098 [Naegleria lovaniensis]